VNGENGENDTGEGEAAYVSRGKGGGKGLSRKRATVDDADSALDSDLSDDDDDGFDALVQGAEQRSKEKKQREAVDEQSGPKPTNPKQKKRKTVPVHKKTLTAQQRAYKPLDEIRFQQRNTANLLKLAPFTRIIKDIIKDLFRDKYRVQSDAKLALAEAAQEFLVKLFQTVNRLAIHGNRVTLMPKDFLCWYDLERTNNGFLRDAPVDGFAAKLLRESAERIAGLAAGHFEDTTEEAIEMEEEA
jgi:histone H3/H4